MNPLRLRHRVGQAIREGALWAPGDAVAVAVSGGLDSVVLLDVLLATRRWHGAALSVVTVDHGARPGSADDAAFVAALAERSGLPCAVARLSGSATDEAALRDARYAVFAALPVDRVALAHHEDDLAETVLLQLLRGAGSAGLAGMRPLRDRYARPLLGVRRAELRAWALHRGLSWRDDPTNEDPRYARNRIRNEVLPLLEQIRPGAARAIARSAAVAARDEAWFAGLVVPGPPWDTAFVRGAPEPVVRRSLLRGLPLIGASAIDAVIAAARRGYGRVPLAGGAVTVDGARVVFTANPVDPTAAKPDVTCSST